MPYSSGISLTGHIALDQFTYIKNIYLYGIVAELTYFHSKKEVKQVSGSRVSAGPLWQFPLSFGTFKFNYCISPEIGIGLYKIRGIYADADAVKWNILFKTGPVFHFSSILLNPNIEFDYIYDDNVPLLGVGVKIGVGLSF